jgi:hypothetical protein
LGFSCLLLTTSAGAETSCDNSLGKVAYYAHPISIYNTPQERRDIELIESLGFVVLNPNAPEHEAGYQREGMIYFENLLRQQAQTLFFRSFPDGSIPAGVAKEIAVVVEMNRPVIELPTAIGRRTLSVEETREFLRQSGFR